MPSNTRTIPVLYYECTIELNKPVSIFSSTLNTLVNIIKNSAVMRQTYGAFASEWVKEAAEEGERVGGGRPCVKGCLRVCVCAMRQAGGRRTASVRFNVL